MHGIIVLVKRTSRKQTKELVSVKFGLGCEKAIFLWISLSYDVETLVEIHNISKFGIDAKCITNINFASPSTTSRSSLYTISSTTILMRATKSKATQIVRVGFLLPHLSFSELVTKFWG